MAQTTASAYRVGTHPEHPRIKRIELDSQAVRQFREKVKDVDLQRIEYVPFIRFYVADQFRQVVGDEFVDLIRSTLTDRATGAFMVCLNDDVKSDKLEDHVKLSTAVTHLIGTPNHDAMSGKFYATFSVKHTDESDTYLRKAYRNLEFHTDGAFVNEATDWLLMMKIKEVNAKGGESRLLHLDDWEDLDKFRRHPLATHKFKITYADRKSKNTQDVVYAPIFYQINNGTCIRFNDQATHPETVEEGLYLKNISDSMENSKGVRAIKLPEGHFVMINNHFWVHGREAFEPHPELYRELLRQRGSFSNAPYVTH